MRLYSASTVSTGSATWRQKQAIVSVAHTTAPFGHFVPRARLTCVEIIFYGNWRPWPRSSAATMLALPPQHWGRRAACSALSFKATSMSTCHRGRSLLTAGNNWAAEGQCCGCDRRARARKYGTARGRRNTTNRRDCTALVSVCVPLKQWS